MSIYVIVVSLYLLALIGLGAWKAGKVKTQEDFSLAGRGLGTLVLVGTLLATWIGTGSIFGNAQKTYQIGMGAFILPIAGTLGILLLSFLAFRIRSFEGFTIQDILEKRFGVGARVLGVITLALAYVIIVSYQYRAGAAVVERLAPGLEGTVWPKLIVAFFVIAYTALAGMISVAYTDVANGVLIIIGIAIALPMVIADAGGWEAGIASLPQDLQEPGSSYSALSLINWLLPAFLLILGDANMYQRFFSAKSPKSARRSATILVLGILVVEAAIIALALFGRVLVEQGHINAPDNVAHIIVAISFEALPPFLGAMLMAVIIAIVVSTADSYLLAPATSLVRDVYQRFVAPDAPAKRVVLLGRVIVVLLGLVALWMAFQSELFFEISLFAYTVYGATITPVMLAAFFWPRATKKGGFFGMLAGISVALVWQGLAFRWGETTDPTVFEQWAFGGLPGPGDSSLLTSIDAVLPALLASTIVLILVSLLDKAPEPSERAI
jgi:SSS family solute:Na+ symporter